MKYNDILYIKVPKDMNNSKKNTGSITQVQKDLLCNNQLPSSYQFHYFCPHFK